MAATPPTIGGNLACQIVGAVMAAEQGHGDAAVFGNGDDGWLGPLVAEQRGQGADDDAGGAEGHDRLAIGEEPTEMAGHIVEAHGRIGNARRVAVQRGVGQLGNETLRERETAGAEDDDGGHRCAAAGDGTSTIEK